LCLGTALFSFTSARDFESFGRERSRPTAVNMRIASEAVKGLAVEEAGKEGATGESTVAAVVAACEAMMQEDLTQNQVPPFPLHTTMVTRGVTGNRLHIRLSNQSARVVDCWSVISEGLHK
jgi:hypothetical protein